MKQSTIRIISLLLLGIVLLGSIKLYQINREKELSARSPQTALAEALSPSEVVEAPKPIEPVVEPVDVVRDNPQNCNRDTQWILTDGSCKDKVVAAPRPVVTVSGSWVDQCHAWAAMAGISLNSYAIKLLERESKCNPTAYNKSGAGGIPQALPYTKMGCGALVYSDTTAICQLRWFQSYVFSRYGSYQAALAHSYKFNWY